VSAFQDATTVVPIAKLVDYLLDTQHEIGGPKARFFIGIGFSQREPELLEEVLVDHLLTGKAIVQLKQHAKNVRIEGKITAPNGKKYELISVWQILNDGGTLSFVTAFPGRR
jgi:hypothetical protein